VGVLSLTAAGRAASEPMTNTHVAHGLVAGGSAPVAPLAGVGRQHPVLPCRRVLRAGALATSGSRQIRLRHAWQARNEERIEHAVERRQVARQVAEGIHQGRLTVPMPRSVSREDSRQW